MYVIKNVPKKYGHPMGFTNREDAIQFIEDNYDHYLQDFMMDTRYGVFHDHFIEEKKD